MKLKLEGIWTPIPTPLTKRGRVDTDATRRLVDFLIEAGIDGLLPLGTSGEFALLQREERKTLVDVVVDQADSRVPVVAGAAASAMQEGVALLPRSKEGRVPTALTAPPESLTAPDQG